MISDLSVVRVGRSSLPRFLLATQRHTEKTSIAEVVLQHASS
jgi:hypothetical protein